MTEWSIICNVIKKGFRKDVAEEEQDDERERI